MDQNAQKVILAIAYGFAGYVMGSTIQHNRWARRWKQRNVVEVNAFRKVLDVMHDGTSTPNEVVEILNDELEFVMIALRQI